MALETCANRIIIITYTSCKKKRYFNPYGRVLLADCNTRLSTVHVLIFLQHKPCRYCTSWGKQSSSYHIGFMMGSRLTAVIDKIRTWRVQDNITQQCAIESIIYLRHSVLTNQTRAVTRPNHQMSLALVPAAAAHNSIKRNSYQASN